VMLNEERLLKIIEDMTEVVENLKDCKNVLETTPEDKNVVFIEFGLKQIFVDFFITVEHLISMLLKENKKFKIGIDMKESLSILNRETLISEEIYLFLNEARLLRNRISHRYKEPTRAELIEFININIDKFDKVIVLAKRYM
ncbi:MAG: HepT-like ribonuclease domain-containing protein, partial [Bacilli bacterium]